MFRRQMQTLSCKRHYEEKGGRLLELDDEVMMDELVAAILAVWKQLGLDKAA